MRHLRRWLVRLALLLVMVITALAAPVVYVDQVCIGDTRAQDFASALPPEHRRDESRTYTTYPEWHIVHAYDDYAQVIAVGDPHDFAYLRAIAGFWSSLCPLAGKAADHGGFTTESKMTIYTIGVSFTLEMALKGIYEETFGRLAATLRGANRNPLDDLSAAQARAYATFLQQTPWYDWDFRTDRASLADASTGTLRDHERRLALGLEYGAKAVYADAIRAAVAATTGDDEQTLRAIVNGLDQAELVAIPSVTVVAAKSGGIEIETPRYRTLTHILAAIAAAGGDLAEIAGNDDILLTAISPGGDELPALYRFPRQGYGDERLLIEVKVTDLSATLRMLAAGQVRLEHIHDY
jgi:hypothetical protein